MNIPNTISDNIRRIREHKGLKQSDLAKALDMDAPNYHRLERRDSKLTIEQLKRIAKVLEVSIYQILGTDNETLPNDLISEILNNYPGKETEWLKINMVGIVIASKTLAYQLGIGNLRHIDEAGTIFRVPVKDLKKTQMDDLRRKGWTMELTDDHKLELQIIINKLTNSINSLAEF